ncbi:MULTISPECIES: macro domain-containing protein [Nocardia]|uniref:macro domain-containing protein n=1 Tax=Nocardia TaxID=1817 RepID=UPI000D691D6F|nr:MULTISPECIES: macro domain-containing protein [Nocardia]
MPGTEIRYTTGDATAPEGEGPLLVVHMCNNAGRWGRGFVRAVSDRWPGPEHAYRQWHRSREQPFELGEIQLVPVEENVSVVNMIGQHGIADNRTSTPPIRYDAVARCLTKLADHAIAAGASVHTPRIGAGLAGGRWEQIAPLIDTHLCRRGIAVTVYDLP